MPRSPAAHVARHPPPLRPPPPPAVQQLRVIHFFHSLRHATATQHTQRHNVVPPLLPNHERNTQRILIHVLHALHVVLLLVFVAAPRSLAAGGIVVLEEVRRSNRAGVRVAVLALQLVQQERARRQLFQRVHFLLPP
ncbi:hypothetical protein TcG_10362 [Trypanosoma cruzi]|nr:hypothetical protein TcG_10362 [Trypanosoma cruzi]